MNDANNAGTLAPCPFCKSRCVTATRDEHGWKIVECDDCGARGPCIDLDGDQYIDRWNALSTPNAPVELAGLLLRLRSRTNDAPMDHEHMMDEAIEALESQAKAMSEAEQCKRGGFAFWKNIARIFSQRAKSERARALAADARLAEAMNVIEPFTNACLPFTLNGDCTMIPASAVEAARAFTNAAKD